MGKLIFCGYLISRFYPTREIRENLMHVKRVLQYFTGWMPVLLINNTEALKDVSVKSRTVERLIILIALIARLINRALTR